MDEKFATSKPNFAYFQHCQNFISFNTLDNELYSHFRYITDILLGHRSEPWLNETIACNPPNTSKHKIKRMTEYEANIQIDIKETAKSKTEPHLVKSPEHRRKAKCKLISPLKPAK